MPVREWASCFYRNFRKWPDDEENNSDFIVPIVYTPEDFVICVAGGTAGTPPCSLPGMSQAATEVIEK